MSFNLFVLLMLHHRFYTTQVFVVQTISVEVEEDEKRTE